jgi:hypothetical protein
MVGFALFITKEVPALPTWPTSSVAVAASSNVPATGEVTSWSGSVQEVPLPVAVPKVKLPCASPMGVTVMEGAAGSGFAAVTMTTGDTLEELAGLGDAEALRVSGVKSNRTGVLA